MSQLYKTVKSILGINGIKLPTVFGALRTTSTTAVTDKQLQELLQVRFANAKEIRVEDVSGGCGAMFDIYVASDEFKGLSIVKQHKAVTETLKDQIKQIHGLRIETKAA